MNSMKRSIKRIFWLIFLLFVLAILYMIKITVFDSNSIISNSYNPRLNYTDDSVKRGDIRDINGNVMAYSEKNGESTYVREYVYGEDAAHVTGYTGIGKSGLESAENFELQKLHNEFYQRIRSILTKDELIGNSVVTTINMDIQKKASELLGNQKGAVVVMEPSTGRILAMVSYPDFSPNTIVENWNTLREGEDSPLINRAVQGLYPPGSTFKIITALSAMENVPDVESFTYTCTGEAEFQGKVIHCFDGKAHGEVNLNSAMAVSCNCYFAELSKKIGPVNLKETTDRLHFSDTIPFALGYSTGSFALNKNSTESELVETAIGQGRTLINPLYMAMLTSAVANDGMMMKPYIIDHIEYYNGGSGKITVPQKMDQVMTKEEADRITVMMEAVVNEGTGTAANISGYQAAGKTGTAENPNGADHSWFIGFAPSDDPKVAVAVVLENSDYKKAAPIAGKLMSAVLNN